MTKPRYAIGLMSGTSLDGIDVVLTTIEGTGKNTKLEVIAFDSYDLDANLRDRIQKASHPDTSSVDLICSLNFEIGKAHSDAVTKLLTQIDFKEKIDFIASHGQTIYHIPNPVAPLVKSTLQIGDPSFLAYEHKTDVIFNFRVMDIVDGGDGAPLVPYAERILYHDETKTRLLQNIGGIGNVTNVAKNGDLSAFDTGPGNMMMNAAVMYYYNEGYDKNGQYALQGKLIDALYEELINHPYLKLTPPKSTGREMFGEDVVQALCERFENKNDVIYTLTRFTAYTIAQSYKDFIFPTHDVDQIIIGGGGAYNPVLLDLIRAELPGYDVITQEDLGFSSDAKEAIAFVILGNETLNKKANNEPNATGSKHPMILGQIAPNPWQ